MVPCRSPVGDLEALWEAVRLDPTSDEAMAAFRARAWEAGEVERLAEVCVGRGRALAQRGDARAVDAWVESAGLYGEELGRVDLAERWYREALERDPGHRQALHALGLLLYHAQRWDELIGLYRSRLADADDGEKATLHSYVAEVLDERLRDPAAALSELLLAVQRAPQNLRLLPRLETLAERTGRWEDLAVVLAEAGIHQEAAEIRAGLAYRLAELYLGPLADRNRALVHLRSAAVELDLDPMAVEDVEDATGFRDQLEAAKARLEQASRDRRVHPHPVRLERELARIYEFQHGDHRRALGALARALVQSPADRELQDEVLRLGLVASDLDRVATTFESLVEQSKHPLLRTFLRLRLGHLYGQALGQPERAAEVYQAILRDEPQHSEAQRRLAPLLDRLGRSDGLPEAPSEEPAPATTEESEWAARVQAAIDEASDLPRAESLCDQALEQHPDSELLLELLEEIHRRQHHWEAVATVLRRRLQRAERPELRSALFKTLAALFEHQLGSVPRALEVLNQAATEGSFDLEISREQERLHLERLDWAQVRSVLRDRVEHSEEPSVRARARATLARLAFELEGDVESAEEHLQVALEEAPDDPDVIGLAARVAERQGHPEAAATHWERLARAEGDTEAWLEAGWLRLSPLSDLERAQHCFRQAMARDPAAPEACRGLFEVARRRDDPATALVWAMRTAELTPSVELRAELVVQAADLSDQALGDDSTAVELYAMAASLLPDRPELRARLGQLLVDRDPTEAHRCLVTAAESEADSERAAAWLEEAGAVAEQAGRPDAALAAHRAALARQNQRPKALRAVARLLEAQAHERPGSRGVWEEIYELAATFLLAHEHEAAREVLAEVYLQMARAKRALHEPEASVRLARHAVKLAPSAEAWALIADTEEALERWAAAAAAVRSLSRLRPDLTARLDDLVRCGELHQRAKEHHRAAAVFEEAFRSAPERADLCDRAAAARHAIQDAATAADLAERHARLLTGAARAEALRKAAGWVRGTARSRARKLLREAFDVSPTWAVAEELAELSEYDGDLEEVVPVYERAAAAARAEGRWSDMAQALERASHIAAFRLRDPQRLAESIQSLSEVRASPRWSVVLAQMLARSDDTEAALEAHKAVLARVPGHQPSLEGIRSIYENSGRQAAAAVILQLFDPEHPNPAGWSCTPWVFETPNEPLDATLSVLAPVLLTTQRDALRVPPPVRRDRLGEAGVPYPVFRALNRAFERVGRPLPPLYGRPGALLQPTFLDEPCLVLDPDGLSHLTDVEIEAWAGHASAYLDLGPLTLTLVDPWTLHAVLRSLSEDGEPSEARKRVRTVHKQLDAARLRELDVWVQAGALESVRFAEARERYVARAAAAALVASGSVRQAMLCAQSVHGADRARWHAHLIRFVSRPDVLAWLERAELERDPAEARAIQ
jgi:golgin subfamily B member 1